MALGRKTGGRQKGTVNKRTQELEREVAERLSRQRSSASRPDARDRMRATASITEAIASDWMAKNSVEIETPEGKKRQLNAGVDHKTGAFLAEAAQRAWYRVAEYEHAKLSSVTLKQEPLDLSRYSDAELAELRRLVAIGRSADGREIRDGAEATRH